MFDVENPQLDDEITRAWLTSPTGSAAPAYVPDIEKVLTGLRRNRYEAQYFATAAEALTYLDGQIDGKQVGIGDSMTLETLGLHEALKKHNQVTDVLGASKMSGREFVAQAKKTMLTDIFLLSASAVTESGILVNMDGTGNRVAAGLFGHEKVYYVIGVNKICPDLEHALWRVRNVSAPRNCHRKGRQTPCGLNGDHCYNCATPVRICNSLVISFKRMNFMKMEVVIVGEDMGL